MVRSLLLGIVPIEPIIEGNGGIEGSGLCIEGAGLGITKETGG